VVTLREGERERETVEIRIKTYRNKLVLREREVCFERNRIKMNEIINVGWRETRM